VIAVNEVRDRLQSIAAGIAALTVVLAAEPVMAHPLSTTSVTIARGEAGTLVATLVIDAAALITKLEADQSPMPTVRVGDGLSTPTSQEARIRELSAVLDRAVHLTNNGAPLALVIRGIQVDAVQNATVTFTTALPSDPAAIVWQTSLARGTYALSVEGADGESTLEWIAGASPSTPVSMRVTDVPHTISRGVVLGFTHIVPLGVDHVLFVMGLALFGARGRQLLLLVTAFTLAHSVTLGLGLYGLVSVPSRIVEPLIAVSVAYVGVENLFGARNIRRRAMAVFGFGLLHGLGFASVLTELTNSAVTRLWTLGAFNLGVELGQLTVLAATLGALATVRHLRVGAELRLATCGSAAVGLVGAVWTMERIFGG
jgi:hypothetical protein